MASTGTDSAVASGIRRKSAGAGSVSWVRLRGGSDSLHRRGSARDPRRCKILSSRPAWHVTGGHELIGCPPRACGFLAGVLIAGSAAGGPGHACPDVAGDVGRVVADPVDKRGAAGVLVVHAQEVQARGACDAALMPGKA